MRLRRGVDLALEAEANAILFPVLKMITRPSERDVLTDHMIASRYRREVYVTSGSPDAAIRQGQFNRAYNPASTHLNSRDRVPRASRIVDGRLLNANCWIDNGSSE